MGPHTSRDASVNEIRGDKKVIRTRGTARRRKWRQVQSNGSVTKKGSDSSRRRGGGDDLFVHYSNIEGEGYRTLTDDQRVEYEPGEGRKGPEATKVRPV